MTEPLLIVGGGLGRPGRPPGRPTGGDPRNAARRRGTFAHKTGDLAEMVCSNSFRSDDDEQNAVGLLHWEMRQAGSLIMAMADAHKLPAGGALAVDRAAFARAVTERLRAHPLVAVETGEVTALPDRPAIIATGPLTSDALGAAIRARPARTRWPSSTPSRRSSISIRSTCRKGLVPVAL
jgi:methylenetetrahydrofolate--tRNA-(uracil-5-)-methyltransferase